jgi:hypothetical protein
VEDFDIPPFLGHCKKLIQIEMTIVYSEVLVFTIVKEEK